MKSVILGSVVIFSALVLGILLIDSPIREKFLIHNKSNTLTAEQRAAGESLLLIPNSDCRNALLLLKKLIGEDLGKNSFLLERNSEEFENYNDYKLLRRGREIYQECVIKVKEEERRREEALRAVEEERKKKWEKIRESKVIVSISHSEFCDYGKYVVENPNQITDEQWKALGEVLCYFQGPWHLCSFLNDRRAQMDRAHLERTLSDYLGLNEQEVKMILAEADVPHLKNENGLAVSSGIELLKKKFGVREANAIPPVTSPIGMTLKNIPQDQECYRLIAFDGNGKKQEGFTPVICQDKCHPQFLPNGSFYIVDCFTHDSVSNSCYVQLYDSLGRPTPNFESKFHKDASQVMGRPAGLWGIDAVRKSHVNPDGSIYLDGDFLSEEIDGMPDLLRYFATEDDSVEFSGYSSSAEIRLSQNGKILEKKIIRMATFPYTKQQVLEALQNSRARVDLDTTNEEMIKQVERYEKLLSDFKKANIH